MAKYSSVTLADSANPIQCAFSLLDPEDGKRHILIARFIGRYRIGCQGNPDANFIEAMARAAVHYWAPSGVIVDLSELEYEWGDMMEGVLNTRSWAGFELPAAFVLGPKCRDAIATLIFGIDTTKPATEAEGCFDNLSAAVEYLLPHCGRWPANTPAEIKRIFGGLL